MRSSSSYQVRVFRNAAKPTRKKLTMTKKLYKDERRFGF